MVQQERVQLVKRGGDNPHMYAGKWLWGSCVHEKEWKLKPSVHAVKQGEDTPNEGGDEGAFGFHYCSQCSV